MVFDVPNWLTSEDEAEIDMHDVSLLVEQNIRIVTIFHLHNNTEDKQKQMLTKENK